jgi:tripartite-type tricarboxylate transporter receptor subunit TctC
MGNDCSIDDRGEFTMTLKRLRGFAMLAALAATNALGQAFPDKPVRVINGFAAGGGSDILLRAFVTKWSELLGQQVVVEYRTGAGGNVAMEAVAKAPADGYTLLMGSPGLVTNPSLYDKLPFDPQKDFAPVSLVGSVTNVLVVNPAVSATNVRELVALAKAQPGKFNYASPGAGTSLHLAAELFKLSAGVDIVHVPYKGGGQAQADVMGGQVQMMFNVLPSALPQVRAGKLRALAVTGRARHETLPEVPTMIESGLADYTAITWNGIVAPAGTPRPVIEKLNQTLVAALRSPEMKEQYLKIGTDPWWSTPEEFAQFMREEAVKWRRVIQAAGIKAQ